MGAMGQHAGIPPRKLVSGGQRNPSPQSMYLLCVPCCLSFTFIDHVFEGKECISLHFIDDQKGDLYLIF